MTVSELITRLQQCNPTDIVIIAKDSEGNDHSPLADTTEDMYIASSTWSGELFLRSLTPEDRKNGFTTEDVRTVKDGAVPCVTLGPVN